MDCCDLCTLLSIDNGSENWGGAKKKGKEILLTRSIDEGVR